MSNIRNRRVVEPLQAVLAGVLMSRRGDGTTSQLHSFLIATGASLLAIALTFGCYLQGALPRHALIEVTSAIVAAVLVFGVVFSSGLNRAATDPRLTVYQLGVATFVMMYAMYFAEAGAGSVFPVIVLMIFMFGVIRLRTRALLRFALMILAVHAATIALHAYLRPDVPDLGVRLLQWGTLAATLPWFALMGGYIRGMREELRNSNALQRAALTAARASELRLAEAHRIARLGSWTYDPATKVGDWSQEMYRIYDADPAQPVPLGSDYLLRVYPDDHRHYRELIRPALDEGRGFDSEYRIILPGGEIRWVHVVGEPEVDVEGRTILLRGTTIDITEHKAQEVALRQARDEASAAKSTLDDAIKVLPEAFALFGADDCLVLWNARYAALFADYDNIEIAAGMPYTELVRASVANGEPIPPEFANDIDAYVVDRVRLHRDPPATREVQTGGGRWLKVSEGHTTFGGIVGVRSDITERKQLEQRQAMEHAVTRLLADSAKVGETMPRVIRTICEALGWDCGARWQLDGRDDLLHCVDFWSIPEPDIAAFSASCALQTFGAGSTGLICSVQLTGKPKWIADVSQEPGFKRAGAAAAAGLRGAFAFPIRVGSKLAGAMEFFSHDVRQPDAALLRVLESIGLQIGQFLARASAQEQLHQRAHYDHLTGLPNRSLFNELLKHAFAKAKRNGTQLAILFVDLDGFKAVNDRYGHDAGDRLLAAFSQRLQSSLRQTDTVMRHGVTDTAARLGGDEFVILIDDLVSKSALAMLANRILAAAAKPFDLAGHQANVTASIGIGVYPDSGQDSEGLIKAADSAMYEAKQSGRNAFRFHAAVKPRQIHLVA